MTTQPRKKSMFRSELYRRAIVDSFVKLNPRWMVRNPVMFVVEVVSVLTTALWMQALAGKGEAPASFIGAIAIWLWFTVLFANFSEALAEGRGKAQAEALQDPLTGLKNRRAFEAAVREISQQSPDAFKPVPPPGYLSQ